MTVNKMKSGLSSAMRLLVVLIMTCYLAACSSDLSDTAKQLLETVPATASNVMVCNIPMIIENADGKVKDNKITLGKNSLNTIIELNDSDSKFPINTIFQSDSGIEPSVIVVFWYGGKPVVTGILDDTSKFKSFVTASVHQNFTDNDGVSVCDNIAIKGNQFWIFNKKANTDNVNEWSKLSSHQNYLSNKHTDQLSECKYPVAGLLDIMATLNSAGGDFRQAATRQMMLSALFDDAQFLSYNIDFKKAECIITADVVNSKGNPASVNLPFNKIKSSEIEALGGTGNMFAAININQKMIEKINKMLKQVGGIPASIEQLVGGINGTCVMKWDTTSGKPMIQVPVTKNETAGLSKLLGIEKNENIVYKDNMLIIEPEKQIAGTIQASEAGKALAGAYMGIVATPTTLDYGKIKGVSKVTLTAVPDDGGIQFRITMTACNPKQKFLEQFYISEF